MSSDRVRYQSATEIATVMPPEMKADIEANKVTDTKKDADTKNDADADSNGDKDLKSGKLSDLFSTAEPYDYFLMIIGTIGALITGASIPFFNVLFGKMLDALNKDPSSFSEGIAAIALAFVWVSIANLFSGLAQVACWTATGERQTQKLREKYVKAILKQEIGWFDSSNPSQLSSKLADTTGKLQDGLGRKVGDLMQYIAQFIAAFFVGLYLCWRLTVVLLASFPLIGGAGYFMITAITAASNQSLEQYANAGGLATEALSYIRTVTALNAQPDVVNKYFQYLDECRRIGITKGLNVGLGNGAVFGAAFLTYALGFWYGSKLVADQLGKECSGEECVTGGDILAVFFAVIMGSIALGQMAPPLAAFTSAKAAIYPMMEIINRKPLIDGFADSGEKPEEKPKGLITLENVHFSYPTRPDIEVCNGYNLAVNPGETVALVGRSGCGKSTVMNLLLRFYDPSSGSICLDNKEISKLNVRWLRNQIGYVGQEPILFAGTIAENIAYGLGDVERAGINAKEMHELIIIAAKQANAHDFIMSFENQYETLVGSNGVSLSGGQKQRVAIARALVKKPSILLLDEATSALDAVSEKIVQESIDKLSHSKTQTTIIIAHRLSTIRNADKIATISDGKIVEVGSHDDLIAKNGIYADLVRLQMTTGGDAELTYVGSALDIEETEKVRKMSLHSDDKVASKVDPTVKVVEEVIDEAEKSLLWKRSWDLVYENILWLALGIFGACTFGAIFPCWGMLLAKTQNMFYYTSATKMKAKGVELAGYYVLLSVISLVSSTLNFWGIGKVGENISYKVRGTMFEAIMKREIGYFDREENAVGALTTKLADDSRVIHKAFGEALAKQIQAFFTLVIGLGIGLSASWQITLVVLATFPLNIIASAIQMQAIAGQQYDGNGDDGNSKLSNSKNGKASDTVPVTHGAIISTAFNNMRTIAAFSMQFKIADTYCALTNEISEKRIKRSITAGLGFGGSNSVLFLTYALLFWYGSTLIESGDVEFEQMMTAILSLMLGALGLGQAMIDMGDQKAGLIAAKRVFKNIDDAKNSPINGLSNEGIKPTADVKGKIELRNINFVYPTRPDSVVCKNFNLVINPGEVVAFVGPSGSGKSTIINLLLRFYDPVSGEILLDDEPIRNYNVRWLRSQLSWVGQEPVLFKGTVSENIQRGRKEYGDITITDGSKASVPHTAKSNGKYSMPVATDVDIEMGEAAVNITDVVDDDVKNACIASNAHDFITSFTDGYDTDVGEGSILVSGGQKQRICIARALIKNAGILLFDEATSALDATSEKLVQDAIDKLSKSSNQQKTIIIIAHRLTTIRNADKIVVIDKGEIVEVGSHDQLLSREGLYHQLWSKQSGIKTNRSSNSLLTSVQ